MAKKAMVKRAVKGNWLALKRETSLKVHQKLPEKVGETIAEIQQRHAYIGKCLQLKAIEAVLCRNLMPRNFREALVCLKTGIEIEREALDLDKQPQITSVQVKFADPKIEEWAK